MDILCNDTSISMMKGSRQAPRTNAEVGMRLLQVVQKINQSMCRPFDARKLLVT
jgi:hypothetical protein